MWLSWQSACFQYQTSSIRIPSMQNIYLLPINFWKDASKEKRGAEMPALKKALLTSHGSLVSSATTILWLQVRIPSTPLKLFNLYYWSCNEKRTKINKKRPGWPIFNISRVNQFRGIFPLKNRIRIILIEIFSPSCSPFRETSPPSSDRNFVSLFGLSTGNAAPLLLDGPVIHYEMILMFNVSVGSDWFCKMEYFLTTVGDYEARCNTTIDSLS